MQVHRFYGWLIAGALGTSTAMTADVRPASTWQVVLGQGHREGLSSAPDRLELGPDAQASTLFDSRREGRYRSDEWPVQQSPATLTVRMDSYLPPGTAIVLHLRARTADRWQPWKQVAPGEPLILDRPAHVLQLRAVLLSSNARSPIVNRLEVVPQGEHAAQLRSRSLEGGRTFRVFATREGLIGRRTANGHRVQARDRFVALPAWSVLNDRDARDYEVRITYRGRSAVAPVWDVGPWNAHDNYWSTNREMWRDLPRGMPEAQAAHNENYNHGRDELGRHPNLPNGIDIADGIFWDELGMSDPGWVEVTFLWLDEGATSVKSEDTAGPVAKMITATKLRNGQIFLRWYGRDNPSGVASFDVQVQRRPNGAWSTWLQGEHEAEGLFKERIDGYLPSFRVRAQDKSGNVGSYSAPLQVSMPDLR